jgi:ammonium transporter, Amt family
MSEEQLLAGDDMIHGESAYVLGPCEAHEHLLAGHYIKRSDTESGNLGMGGVTIGQDPIVHAEKGSGSGSHELKHD